MERSRYCAPRKAPGKRSAINWPTCWPSRVMRRGCGSAPMTAIPGPALNWPTCWPIGAIWWDCGRAPITAHPLAAARLADLLIADGDYDGAIALLQVCTIFGYYTARRLAEVLAEHGDLDHLRMLADSGNSYYTADVLERGEIPIRIDTYASHLMAGLLGDQRNLEGLQALINSGIPEAAMRMAEILADHGYIEDSDRLRQFGFAPDGSIASGPTWLPPGYPRR